MSNFNCNRCHGILACDGHDWEWTHSTKCPTLFPVYDARRAADVAQEALALVDAPQEAKRPCCDAGCGLAGFPSGGLPQLVTFCHSETCEAAHEVKLKNEKVTCDGGCHVWEATDGKWRFTHSEECNAASREFVLSLSSIPDVGALPDIDVDPHDDCCVCFGPVSRSCPRHGGDR